MKIGIINEVDDQRVALSPEIVRQFIANDNEILIESDAGTSAYLPNATYKKSGATIMDTTNEVLAQADLIVTLHPIHEERWQHIKPEAILVSLFAPYVDETIPNKLKKESFTVFSLDMIPRTTQAQAMDVLSSMASIAGYRAVIEAANYLPRYFPMLSSAAGTVAPSKVLVLGAGVAGLQAIATARRLGAVVSAFDTRAAAKEEVQSLGAKFVEVEGARDDASAGGYGVEQTDDYKQRQQALIQEKAAQSNVIISTAQVRGPKAPILVTKETVEKMQPGSVIVDLAASTGGNCEVTVNNEVIHYSDVIIIGDSNLAEKVATHASRMFAKNIYNFLNPMIKEGKFEPDWENRIVKESCIFTSEMTLA
ncbi:MAG: NAD(P) transhydrogenase subunit alpha [Cyclobacteriaceae bacterium]